MNVARNKKQRKARHYLGYLLFSAGILLFLWLGGTSEFISPSSSPGSARKKGSKSKISGNAKGARLFLEEESFDFGRISQETRVEHVFKLTNSGTAELTINNIEFS